MKCDIKDHVTKTIIDQIEAGTPPWRKPWTGDTTGIALPRRHNGTQYRGINILMLWAAASMSGYQSSRWMTFRQALELGGCVRKGEKATRSVFYGTYQRDTDNADTGETETRQSRFAKVNYVFNADQIDGLPEDYYHRPAPPRDLGTQSDPELDAFFADTGATIVTTDEPRAYFHPGKDIIHMPPIATFFEASRYYGVLGHEAVHWACGPKRLDTQKAHCSKRAYAFDELVAEIGACFLGVQLGAEPDFEQSAAYLESWLRALKDDKDLIFKAAAEAQKAVDHINDAVQRQQQTRANAA